MSELRYWRHRAEPRHVTTVSMMGTINAPQWGPVSVLTDAELASVERAAAEKAWDEGEQAGYEDALGEQRGIRPNESARNPYRREEA